MSLLNLTVYPDQFRSDQMTEVSRSEREIAVTEMALTNFMPAVDPVHTHTLCTICGTCDTIYPIKSIRPRSNI